MDHLMKAGWILVCFFTLSCERNIELTIDPPKASAVLNASLSTDSVLTATVSRTTGYYPNNNLASAPVFFLDKASITVFANDIKQGVMEKGEKNGQYRLPGYYPSIGDKIRMEVQTNDFAPLSAEVTIPSQPEILSVDTQMYNKPFPYYSENNIDVKLRFKEPVNETNYYLLSLSVYSISAKDPLERINLYPSVTHNEDLLFENLSPVFSGSGYTGYYDYSDLYYNGYQGMSFFLFNDKDIHDDAYTLKFALNNVPGSISESDSLSLTVTCRICLYALSESYYLHYRSKLLQWKQQDDPFGEVGLREPVPTYTNVRNGYGLLSAKQVAVYEFKVAPADMPPSGLYAD
jgi:hypothetical protein